MKKLILVLGVLMGLVGFTVSSYALNASGSTNKTLLQIPLVSSYTNGNTAFVTGTTNGGQTVQQCAGQVTSTLQNTLGQLLSCPGVPITGIQVSGGASGGTVTIYDAATNINSPSFPAEAGPAEVVFEATVASNTTTYIDIHDAPIRTLNGVVAWASSTSGVVVYTSPAVAVNT